MRTITSIVIFHPGAIGDVMLATPVAKCLRQNFPASTITYVTHPGPAGLLSACDAVDSVVEYDREETPFRQRKRIFQLRPDLIVDLSGRLKSFLLTILSGSQVVRYAKQAPDARPIQHAVDNFLATLDPLQLARPERLFPTISVAPEWREPVYEKLSAQGWRGKPLVGLVPGVGTLRPHRAWLADGWGYLARVLLEEDHYEPVLVGGEDDVAAADAALGSAGDGCLNLVGRLSLQESAALLQACQAVVSGDTGPAHVAVAVGTPVVGLYGPTYPERSGPYGCDEFVVDVSGECRCQGFKICQVRPVVGPGDCMHKIMLEQVMSRLKLALGWEQEGGQPPTADVPSPN